MFISLPVSEFIFGTNYSILEWVAKLQNGTQTNFALQPNATSADFSMVLTGQSDLTQINEQVKSDKGE
jgi:hypothetical protein